MTTVTPGAGGDPSLSTLELRKVKFVVGTALRVTTTWVGKMYGKVKLKSTWTPLPIAVAGT
jgi:hypothetical protein